MDSRSDIEQWTVENVAFWIENTFHLPNLKKKFQDNLINGEILLELTNEVLKNDIDIRAYGIRKKILDEIQKLKKNVETRL